MHLEHLWVEDFRCYHRAELDFADGLTAIVGTNGQGKSSLLEAVSYLATLRSFRGVPNEALVRQGTGTAIVRAEGTEGERRLLIEAEINLTGRNRLQVNRQRVARARDLHGLLRVTVFSPDDLAVVKGGPSLRRELLDETIGSLSPAGAGLRADIDRVLRQRNTLLRQARGRLTDDIASTLDVWDAKFASLGDELARQRRALLDDLVPRITTAYDAVAGRPTVVGVDYDPAWVTAGLAASLAAGRDDDVRRGVTQVGPHRDEVVITIGGLPTRTHASQGEQRSLALALRLATHDLVAERVGASPLLLLDDVFSELDPERSEALVAALPEGQTLLTTAGGLPSGIRPERVLDLHDGHLSARTG